MRLLGLYNSTKPCYIGYARRVMEPRHWRRRYLQKLRVAAWSRCHEAARGPGKQVLGHAIVARTALTNHNLYNTCMLEH